MAKPYCILVLFAVLGLTLFLVIPAEDLSETAYDESELLPYETTPATANLIAQVAALVTRRAPSARAISSQFYPVFTPGSPARQADIAQPGARAALALLCILLC